MLVGYARTSTLKQEAGYDAQIRDLSEIGCEKIYKEQVSSVAHRAELDAALEYVREGDVLCVTKLDRLARSTKHVLEISDLLKDKGVGLRILNLSLDSSTPTGKMMLSMIASVATFEREMMLERQREGIARAQSEGKYKGRAPTAKAKTAQIVEMRNAGTGPSEIAKTLEIGRTSVFRILKDNQHLLSHTTN
jgi:DNA invertase Pin-like site-specific DNA recombinase